MAPNDIVTQCYTSVPTNNLYHMIIIVVKSDGGPDKGHKVSRQ